MIIGGPPCQGFSNKGKNLGLKDPRNFLFLEYIEIVKAIKPEIFIIENVKNLISCAKGYFLEEIKERLNALGYQLSYQILNAKDYGVPQNRERAFIVGASRFSFDFNLLEPSQSVNVQDAISDLAYLCSNEGAFESDYLNPIQSSYQALMRKDSPKLYNHQATNHSQAALEKLKLINKEQGKECLPKNLHGKQQFKSTWGRLNWNKISPTIDTRFDTPSNGTNSHPELHRSITPREAARIQSFSDNYIFYGNKTSVCKQIGNAVPPLLALALGKAILKKLKKMIQIYHANAFEIIKDFYQQDLKVDAIITDPPYNISVKNNFSTLKSAKRQGIDFGEWDKNFRLLEWIKRYAPLVNPNGCMVIFCSYRFISYIADFLEENGFIVKDFIQWVKTNPMPRNLNRRYVQDTEFALWAVKKKAKWVFNKPKNEKYLRPLILKSPVVGGIERVKHPTQKSLTLMEKIISIHTNPNDIVLDPFMGSGTTGLACKRLERNFIGIESEKEYFQIAKKRLNLL
ncbi:hypothetical protein HpCHC28_09060 [Helicobacter pylori]